MGRCETDNLSDSEYFRIADLAKAKTKNKMKRIYSISKGQRKQRRRDFRLRRIEEKTKLLIARSTRWKWLAAAIGLGLLADGVFQCMR